jgi:hypothetical protein
MSTFNDVANLGFCSNANFVGKGGNPCILDISRLDYIWRFDYNYQFPDDFDPTVKASFVSLQETSTLKVLGKLVNAAFATENNTTVTLAGGNKVQLDKLPIEFSAKTLDGLQGAKVQQAVEKAKLHSFVLVDRDGNIFLRKTADGKYAPINSEYFDVQAYTPQGDAEAGTMFMLQLDRSQFDTEMIGVRREALAFNPNDLQDVCDITIQITEAKAAGTIDFKAIRVDNKNQLGLAGATFRVLKTGATPTAITGAITVTENGYRFTRSGGATIAAGDVISVSLWNGTTFTNTALVAGQIYKSNVGTATVVA